jgi:Putative peptidoglycan binding domain
MIMYDTITDSDYPPGARYVAAYVDGAQGDQPNYLRLKAARPLAYVMSVALYPDNNAECLDMEAGAARPQDFPVWWARQRTRGVQRPVAYATASNMAANVLPVLAGTGITRPRVRLWSAHTGAGAHICGPASCGLVPVDCDGTQWQQNDRLDESLLLDTFFSAPAATAGPGWQEQMMQALPVIGSGATGPAVCTVQGLCVARGFFVKVDGVFGPETDGAVKLVQGRAGIHDDGVVGPQTWPALLGLS